MERIIITFTQDGTFRGASVTDFAGQPKPLDDAALNALFPTVNAASLSRVTTLEEDLAALTTAKESATTELETATARADSLESQLAETQTQLATAQGEASSVPSLQSQLDAANARIAELEAVPEEPVVLGVSKLTIMRRLGDKWPTLKAALSTLPEIVQDAWLLAQEIRADDELFLAYKETLKTLLDLTDDEFNALLTP